MGNYDKSALRTKEVEFMRGANNVVVKHQPFGCLTNSASKDAVQELESLMVKIGQHSTPRAVLRRCALVMASKGVKSLATLEDTISKEIGDWMPTGLMKVLLKILFRHVCDEAELRCRKEKAAAILLTRQQTQNSCNAWKVAEQLTPEAVNIWINEIKRRMEIHGLGSVGDTDRPRQAITNLAEARRGGMDIPGTLMDLLNCTAFRTG